MLLTLTGGAGAGKTTLAGALVSSAVQGPASVLHGDDYYFTAPERGIWARDEAGVPRLDVGDPGSVDIERLDADTDAALATTPVVIVDGLFARRVTPRQPCLRLDVFIDLAADLRLARKIERKCVRGGFPIEVLLRNYVEHRRAAHERYIEPLRDECDVIVDGALSPEILAEQIWSVAAAQALNHDS
ncbi:uridine kinase family protein [Kitasatospora sp. HPMI-4]|uniref:uridine kinase family protein n=1 Tax=Kitasatospora sp. HPMI-4 TaxID=3448443 RepID=UPI003F1C94D8